jgi:PIN domain nuclease of toxin-antitoxin system
VRLLLDTHVFLWLQTCPERLGERLALVQDYRNDLFLSAASCWEIAIKYRLGKLPLPLVPADYVPPRVRAIGAQTLAIQPAHALAAAELPPRHRDPFDRLLVAQALDLGLTILTADGALAGYPASTILV